MLAPHVHAMQVQSHPAPLALMLCQGYAPNIILRPWAKVPLTPLDLKKHASGSP